MGIHGLWDEISSSGKDEELGRLSSQFYESKGRPLILAIDLNIWLMAGRTFGASMSLKAKMLQSVFYKLGYLLRYNIKPVFVLDGPRRPEFKRKKIISTADDMSSEARLAIDLIRLFGFVVHNAPGEAEAECARLQQHGLVDFLLSIDSDTLVFGGDNMLYGWKTSNNPKMVKVRLYKRSDINLSWPGLLLVALFSGGDYDSGVSGFGMTLSTRAARHGYGESLLKSVDNPIALKNWKESLIDELRTNKNKIFERKNSSIVLDESFPNREVLKLYTQPIVSNTCKRFDDEFQIPDVLETVKFLQQGVLGEGSWNPLPKKFLRSYVTHFFEYRLRITDKNNIYYGGDDTMKFRIKPEKTKEYHGEQYVKAIIRPCDILDEKTVFYIKQVLETIKEQLKLFEKNEQIESDDNGKLDIKNLFDLEEEMEELVLVSILNTSTTPWKEYQKYLQNQQNSKARRGRSKKEVHKTDIFAVTSDGKKQMTLNRSFSVRAINKPQHKKSLSKSPRKVGTKCQDIDNARVVAAVSPPPKSLPASPTPSKLIKRLALSDEEDNSECDHLKSPTTLRNITNQSITESSSLESISDIIQRGREEKKNDKCLPSPSKRVRGNQQFRDNIITNNPLEKGLLFESAKDQVEVLSSSPHPSQNKSTREVITLSSSPL